MVLKFALKMRLFEDHQLILSTMLVHGSPFYLVPVCVRVNFLVSDWWLVRLRLVGLMIIFVPTYHLVSQNNELFQIIFEAGIVLVVHVDFNIWEPYPIDIVLDVDELAFVIFQDNFGDILPILIFWIGCRQYLCTALPWVLWLILWVYRYFSSQACTMPFRWLSFPLSIS